MKITKNYIKKLILEELSSTEDTTYPITEVSLLNDNTEYFVYIIFNNSPMFSKRNGQQFKEFLNERGQYITNWYAYPNTAKGWSMAQQHKNTDFPPAQDEEDEDSEG